MDQMDKTGKCLGRPVNITEAKKKQAKINVGRPLILHNFCCMLTDYA